MRRLRVALARVRGWWRGARVDRDLQDEIAAHLGEATDDFVRQGLAPVEARRRALIAFGGAAQAAEAHREARVVRWLDHLRRDVGQGSRGLRRSAGFSVTVLVVLAVGIGATAALFILVNRIVLRPLPFPDADRIVVLRSRVPGVDLDAADLSSGLFFHYRDRARSIVSAGNYETRVLSLRLADDAAERAQVTYAGAGVFQTLGVAPALGRLFTEDDGRPGFMNVKWTIPILLSHDYWVSRFGADPAVVGRVIRINDNPRVVVGVMPEGFVFPDPETRIWMLSEIPARSASFGRSFTLKTIARLRDGVSVRDAESELVSLLPGIVGVYRDATPERMAELGLVPIVLPFKDVVVGDVARALWPLFGGMLVLLMVAAANGASLFLVRAEARRPEIAMRLALGASQRQIRRLFVIEALLLTSAASLCGLAIARGLIAAVIALAPADLPRSAEIRVDAAAVVFVLALAVLLAAAFGAISARRQRRLALAPAPGDGAWMTRRRRKAWGQDVSIAMQMALALTLMVGSGLMMRTYHNLTAAPLGFSPERMLTLDVAMPGRLAGRHARLYADLVARVRRIPGVESATMASFVPLAGREYEYPIEASTAPVLFKFFVPGYFETMRTPVVAGQSLSPADPSPLPYPVLVSASLARRLYPGRSAIGQPIRRLEEDGTAVTMAHGPVPDFTIAGVVGDVREESLRANAVEIAYVPVIEPAVEQSIVPTNMTLAVRSAGEPARLVDAVRHAVAEIEPALATGQARTMDAIVSHARAHETFVGALLLLASAASLVLGVVGVYGAVAYAARRRTREIGIRLALGARRGEVIGTIVMSAMRSAGAGAAIGVAVALLSARALGALLFGVAPGDPRVIATVAVLLLSAAAAAGWLAALRAVTRDPLRALRIE
ncbi:MAG TPA: ADOP family duplicated permease [Vicinamibacterales bacterium]|nr:ADOP family duplicated permease [Vicinamibacterales bacterium]